MEDGGTATIGERLRAGDHAAFTELYDATAQGIHDMLSRMVRNRPLAEDLTQATFLRAYERRSGLADPSRVKGWLYAIARNLALDHLSRARPHDPLEETAMGGDHASPALDPAEHTVRAEAVALVWDAAESLEPRQATVLDLSLRHGLAPSDLAGALEVTPDHAAVLVHRARAALGNAVRHLLVARRRGRCERLDALVPAGLRRLTPSQRASVDRHLRRCDTCQATADELVTPDALFASIPLLALPARLAVAPHPGAVSGGPGNPAPTAAKHAGRGGGLKVIAAVAAAAVAIGGAVIVARALDGGELSAGSAPSSPPEGGRAGTPSSDPGERSTRPTSTAALVEDGTGAAALFTLDGIVVTTEGCDGAFYASAPDVGAETFLLGNLHLDGELLVLEATSDTYTGVLHDDGVFHLETQGSGSPAGRIDGRIADDGAVTGVWTDVFLGDCRLHNEIREGHAPGIEDLTA